MARNITPPSPQFSRKVLLISLVFLLANLGIYGLRYLAAPPETLRSVAPRLVSARISDIEVKSPYDETYQAAQESQEIYSGTLVRTGEAEFAELVLDDNAIRLDERTEIKLVKNNFPEDGPFVPDQPRLILELMSGSIWVNALDLIEIRSARSTVSLDNSVAIVTYSAPINRLMVVTGAADLELLNPEGEHLSDFIVPLHNQVTFVDSQVTPAYAALKPSKLRKELKMTPISEEVLKDEWIARNANDFEAEKEAFKDSLINSGLVYKIRSGYQKALSWIAFIPEARRNLAIQRAGTDLAYLLGAVQEEGDLEKAEKVLEDFKDLIGPRGNDPQISDLIVKTLLDIEYTRSGTPAYLLKEYLIGEVLAREGPHVFDIYLTDIRRAFHEEDIQATEIIAAKWLDSWKANLTEADLKEFDRQIQILNHTILSYVDSVTTAVLDVFDESGNIKMAYSEDIEEARFEVISDRLQIAASMIADYKYLQAKQYLKKSYLSLDVQNLSPNLASTQIFLETGKLLAQRIEYAEEVLHGAAEPIDETKFLEYFQTLKRDEALSADLSKFFQLDEEEELTETKTQMPTAAQVAERFLEARINVNYADIALQPSSGFYYTVVNARLIDRGPEGQALSFDATYDYVSNSVTDVVTDGQEVKGSFTLNDIVTLLKEGGELESRIPVPKTEEGIELLITDEEKLEALEGQALAQDVARELAYNQLEANGIIIPNVRNIEILDKLNLNQFFIKLALIQRPDPEEEAIRVNFKYHSGTGEVTTVMDESGVVLLDSVAAEDLKDEVLKVVSQREKELKVINDFITYTKLNDLYIDIDGVTYLPDGKLSFKALELLPLELAISGIYDPETEQFSLATHPQFTAQNIGIKAYFDQLVKTMVISLMQENGYQITADQIGGKYPYEKITISRLDLEGYIFSFQLDLKNAGALSIKREGVSTVIPQLSLAELSGLPAQIQLTEGPPVSEGNAEEIE